MQYLLLHGVNGDMKKIIVEHQTSTGATRNIFHMMERNQGSVSLPLNQISDVSENIIGITK